jgi:glycosyltransferase involved in cell wall biosynthesis
LKRLLIVSYYFPPVNVVASLRASKMAKYLPEYGWESWVLTVVPPPALPHSMPEEPISGRIIRTKYLRPRIRTAPPTTLQVSASSTSQRLGPIERLYSKVEKALDLNTSRMPDRTLGWYPYAVRAGSNLLAQADFDAIYSTSGPPTCHLVARRLQRVFNLPWIADYRDLWSLNHRLARGPLFQRAEEHLERWVVKAAAHLVTVTDPWRDKLATLTGQPVTTIPHGFDEEDFENLPSQGPHAQEPLTLLYVGTLYPYHQDPSPLLGAIAGLDRLSLIQPGDLVVRFVGSDPDYPASLAREHQVLEYVEFTDFVPFRVSLRMQSQASALILIKWGDEQESGHCPAKLYDYLGVGRPILVLGDKPDVVDSIVEDCSAGVCVGSAEEATEVLLSWLTSHRERGAIFWRFNEKRRNHYTRTRAARTLANLLDQVTSDRYS